MGVNLFSRPVLFLLSFFSVAFIVFYLVLCHCNRLSADDHFYFSLQRNSGTWGSIVYLYQHWTPRSSSILWMDLLFCSFGKNAPAAASAINLLLCILVFYFLSQVILRRITGLNILKKELIVISVCFTALFFFTTANIAESWFWTCSSTAYITGIIFLSAGCIPLLSEKNSVSHYFMLFFCFAFAACAAESYTVITGLALGAITLFRLRKIKLPGRKIGSDPLIVKLLFSLFVFTFFSFFMLCSNGTALRSAGLPPAPLLYSFYLALKGTAKFFLITMFLHYPFLLLCSLPFLAMGCGIAAKTNIRFKTSFFSTWIAITLPCLFFLTFFSALPSCIVMSEPPPPRALTHLFLFMALASAVLFIWLGMMIHGRAGVHVISTTCCVAPFVFIMIQACTQLPVALTYAHAIDAREELLLKREKEGFTGTLLIAHLPPSGMICSDEISGDATHPTNRYLKRDLGLPFDCVVNYSDDK